MTPIAPLITSFLREHMPIEQGCSSHTCETYAHAFRLLFVFASKRLGIKPSQICIEQIDAALILDFLAHIEEQRGNCAATRNGRLAAVKAFIKYVCASNEHRAFAFPAKDGENDAFRSGRKPRPIFVPGWRFEERRRYPSYL
jgi:site-specific recombinase XerD